MDSRRGLFCSASSVGHPALHQTRIQFLQLSEIEDATPRGGLQTMPPSSRRSGAFSPPLSSAVSYTPGASPKLNVVSRLAIRGKASLEADVASIRLFLRVSLFYSKPSAK